ncbi:Murein transglycosylase, partial [Globisporangium splendens]
MLTLSVTKRLGLITALLFASSTHAMFRFDCFNNLVVDRVDPITSLGTAGGHLHAISGGNGFSMNADGDAMRNSSCTSCPIGADLSAYWVPQLYVKYKNGSGFGLVESHQIVYYEPRPKAGEKVIAFPPGLKMLAGDPTLRTKGDSIEEKAITWVCIDYDNSHPEQQGIPNFKCPQGLRGQVNFPMCWNGKDLDSPDHKSHVAYATGLDGGDCPKGFQKMVKIFYEAFYSVDKYDSEWVDGKHPFVLSNGDPTGFGFHGDFLNGWDVDVLQAAVDQCTDKNYFNSGECPPLKASFSDKAPAKRCTLQPEIVEPITNIAKLPGNNPVTYVAPVSTPAPATGDGDADDDADDDEESTPTPSSSSAAPTPSATEEEVGGEATDAPSKSTSVPQATASTPEASAETPTTKKPKGCKVKAASSPSAASAYEY